MSWRRFQDIITRCLLEDVLKNKSCNYSFKTSLQDVLEDKKMLRWRRLQDVFSTSSPRRTFIITLCPLLPYVLEGVLKTSWRRLAKTFWRRLQDVFGRDLANMSWRSLGRWKIVTQKRSSRRLQDVLENEKYLLALKYLPRITHHVYWNF